MPGKPGIIYRNERSRKSRSRRPAFAHCRKQRTNSLAIRLVSDSARPSKPARGNPVGRRTANDPHRARTEDEAEALHSRRADARLGSGHSQTALKNAGTIAPDDGDHRTARRTECDICAAPFGPRLYARTCAHHLGRRAGKLRSRCRDRVFVGAIADALILSCAKSPERRFRPGPLAGGYVALMVPV